VESSGINFIFRRYGDDTCAVVTEGRIDNLYRHLIYILFESNSFSPFLTLNFKMGTSSLTHSESLLTPTQTSVSGLIPIAP